jgi:3-hydroxyisobutyrate dehydrogenase-like beta-hydroxyacid dehydrogenase
VDHLTEAGFVGLGAMGASMAMRLVDAGIGLHVLDPAPQATGRFVERGAVVHATPVSVADAVEIVFACLPGPTVSMDVALGRDGVASGHKARVYVELSTVGRAAIEAIAAGLDRAGIALIDAPVSGGPKAAAAGTLAIMLAGSTKALEAAHPYLAIMGKNLFTVGEAPGLAQTMKLVNNLISAANMACAFEALVYGAKAGLDPDLMVRVINASTGRNSATQDKIPRAVLPGTFDYGARLGTIHKDVTLGLAEAEAAGVPMWALTAVGQLWRFAVLQGGGDEDMTSLIRYLERWAGAEVRSANASAPPRSTA